MANIYSLFLFILVERTSSNSAVRNKFIVTDPEYRVRKGGESVRGVYFGGRTTKAGPQRTFFKISALGWKGSTGPFLDCDLALILAMAFVERAKYTHACAK